MNQKEKEKQSIVKYGVLRQSLNIYKVWERIKQRCLNPNKDNFKYYGGRGITIYEPWIKDSSLFIDYCFELKPNVEQLLVEGFQIDRIKNEKGYVPGNIRFITSKENANNTRKNIFVIYHNKKIPLCEAIKESKTSFCYINIFKKLKRGLSFEEAIQDNAIKGLSGRLNNKRKREAILVEWGNELLTLPEVLKKSKCSLNYECVRRRLIKGWSLKDALFKENRIKG